MIWPVMYQYTALRVAVADQYRGKYAVQDPCHPFTEHFHLIVCSRI